MTFSTSRLARPSRVASDRPSALTTPAVTVPANPSGLPIATTSWPTRSRSAWPSGAGRGLPPVVRTTARSDSGIAADDLEGQFRAVHERGRAAVRAGDDVGRGHEMADRLDGDRRAGAAPAQPPTWRVTRRLATDGISRSAAVETAAE